LLDAGNYEEALVLMQHTMALARTLPPTIVFQSFLTALGSTYQALQQWDEAHSILEEAEAVAETLGLGPYGVPTLSQLCMHYAEAGQWEAAYRYALKAIAVRKRSHAALSVLDPRDTQRDLSKRAEMRKVCFGGEWVIVCHTERVLR
jgi:tetratricopeptide (TPR) repeat protein